MQETVVTKRRDGKYEEQLGENWIAEYSEEIPRTVYLRWRFFITMFPSGLPQTLIRWKRHKKRRTNISITRYPEFGAQRANAGCAMHLAHIH